MPIRRAGVGSTVNVHRARVKSPPCLNVDAQGAQSSATCQAGVTTLISSHSVQAEDFNCRRTMQAITTSLAATGDEIDLVIGELKRAVCGVFSSRRAVIGPVKLFQITTTVTTSTDRFARVAPFEKRHARQDVANEPGLQSPAAAPRALKLKRRATSAAPAMLLDGQAAMQAQRFGGDFGGDVGVAIPIAADPRGQRQPAIWAAHLRIILCQRAIEIGVEAREHVPENLADEIQTGADFVGDAGPGSAGLIGEPQGRDLGASIQQFLALARQGSPINDASPDPPLQLDKMVRRFASVDAVRTVQC
jgi:hypothetical protein